MDNGVPPSWGGVPYTSKTSLHPESGGDTPAREEGTAPALLPGCSQDTHQKGLQEGGGLGSWGGGVSTSPPHSSPSPPPVPLLTFYSPVRPPPILGYCPMPPELTWSSCRLREGLDPRPSSATGSGCAVEPASACPERRIWGKKGGRWVPGTPSTHDWDRPAVRDSSWQTVAPRNQGITRNLKK